MPELSNEAINALIKIPNALKYSDSERVPHFKIEIDSVFNDGDSELIIIDNFKTESYMGSLYVKMDSTHRNDAYIDVDLSELELEEKQRAFSGAEPTYKGLRGSTQYTNERQLLWAEQFGYAYSENEMLEVRRLDSLTLEEYKSEIILDFEKEKNAVDFEIEVSSSIRGEDLQYKLNLKSYSELGTQIEDAVNNGIGYIAWHDNSCLSHDLENPYTIEQASTIFFLAKQEVGRRDATYDIYKLRTDAMEEKFSKQEIIDMEMTPEHQSYIDTIVGGIRLQSSEAIL